MEKKIILENVFYAEIVRMDDKNGIVMTYVGEAVCMKTENNKVYDFLSENEYDLLTREEKGFLITDNVINGNEYIKDLKKIDSLLFNINLKNRLSDAVLNKITKKLEERGYYPISKEKQKTLIKK
jgi:hypothetical protein